MVQWDKDSCADAGFLKIDLLGLGMLSAVERCVELIAARGAASGSTCRGSRTTTRRRTRRSSAPRRPASSRSRAARRWPRCGARGPRRSTTSRSRWRSCGPGPIQGGAVNPYIERRQRLREDPSYVVPYEHPSLEPVLRETLGTIIFQDQVIEVAMAFAGFSPGEAEGPAPGDEPQALGGGDRGLPRALRRGRDGAHDDVDEALAERVWNMIVGFSGFGFPKAHGAAFGLLAYQSTWLRVHYGPEFLCRAARRAADGLLSARRARPRGPAPRDRGPGAGRQPQRRRLRRRRTAAGARSGWATSWACAPTRSRRSSPRARPAGRSGRWTTSPRARGRAPALELLLVGLRRWRGDALAGATPPRAAAPCGGSGSRRRATAANGARSSRCRSSCRRRRARAAGRLGAMIADYATTGMTVHDHPWRCCARRSPSAAPSPAPTSSACATSRRAHRRAGRRPPAAGDGERDRLPAARGRARDGQPDRPAGRLRAPPARPCARSRWSSPRAGSSASRPAAAR